MDMLLPAKKQRTVPYLLSRKESTTMTFAKTFGQRHVLHFLDSHVDLFGCRITAASPVGLRVTDGVHQLCLKSTDGCIQREDAPNSVAPELIEDYGSTARRTAATRRGELSRMPRRLTLQQAVLFRQSWCTPSVTRRPTGDAAVTLQPKRLTWLSRKRRTWRCPKVFAKVIVIFLSI